MSLRGYSDDVEALSPRMIAVLRSASRGRTARETALELHVSEATVWTIRSAACSRLGASNVTAAVTVAIRAGKL